MLSSCDTLLGAPAYKRVQAIFRNDYCYTIGLQERLRHWTTWEDWERAKTLSSRPRNGTIYRPWSAKDDDNVRLQLSHKAEIDAGVACWRPLLTIQSNKQMELWINDADPAYTLIHADDLARGDVSRVRVIATQG